MADELEPLRVYLVGCGKQKQPMRTPARELYTGPLFRAAWTYCEGRPGVTYIISARHGLLLPDELVSPYDARMTRGAGSPAAARLWAFAVVGRLFILHGAQSLTLEVHAGADYLGPLLHGRPPSWEVEAPLSGLAQGKRLAWYAARRQEGGANGH